MPRLQRSVVTICLLTMFILASTQLALSIHLNRDPHNAVHSRIKGDIPDDANPAGKDTASIKSSVMAEDHTLKFRFPTPELSVENELLNIEMEGSSGIFLEGKPLLPKFTRTLTFPMDTRVISYELLNIDFYETTIHREVAPLPLSQPHTEADFWEDAYRKYYDGEQFHYEPQPTPRDEEVYNSADPFPSNWFDLRKGMGRSLENDEISLFVVVDFFPVRYLPQEGLLRIATDATFRFSTRTTETRTDPRSGVGTDMVAIGPETMRNTMAPLVEFKTSTGLDTMYVSLLDIYMSTYFPVQGIDNQEMIKYFIKNALESWGISYVMLVGDSDICPVRYARVPDGFDDAGVNQLDGRDVPSDAYYADIYNGTGDFCDWNSNGNTLYGEEADGCDLYYDVYVGRLPAGDNAELSDLVNDILHYEQNALTGGWYLNANLHGTDTFAWAAEAEGEYTLDQIEESGYLAGFDIEKYYETKGTLSKAALVNGINGGIGIAAFSDHGDHHCWGATGQGSGIFDRDDAAGLTNANKLALFTFDACLCGSFDNELQPSLWTDNPGESISEELLLNTGGGGIAVISATRVGWGDGGTNYVKHRSGFIDVSLYRSFQDGKRTPGRMLAGSVAYYLSEVGNDDDKDHKTLTEYICLGDPSLALGGLPLDSSLTNGIATVKPGTGGMYAVRVTNLSPFSEYVDIDFTKLPEGFEGAAAQHTPIIPGGTTNITFSITPASGLLAGEIHELPIGILCRGRGQFLNVTCIVGEEYGVSLTSPLTDDTTDPGVEIPFWVNIKNEGNVEDTIELGFLENLAGWSVWAQAGNITLPPFASTDVTIYIRPSNETLHGMRRITVTAASVKSNGSVFVNLKFNITIRHIYAFEIEQVPLINTVPGEYLLIDIPIRNSGNGEEKFDLEVTMWPDNWTAALREFYLNIEAFDTMEAILELQVPTDAIAGDYSVEVRITSEGGNTEKDRAIDIHVLKVYDLRSTVVANTASADNLEPVNFTMDIANFGNFKDTYQIEINNLSDMFTYSFSQEELVLEAFHKEEVILVVTPKEEAVAGNNNFNVTCVSESNSSSMNKVGLELTVEPSFRCNITPALKNLALHPGEDINITFSIKNLANTHDNILVTCYAGEYFETDFALALFEMEAFSSDSGTLRIKALSDALAGTYYLALRAKTSRGELDENSTDNCLIEVEIRQFFNVTFTPVIVNKDVEPGPMSTTFLITNRGNGIDTFEIEYSGTLAKWLQNPVYNRTVGPNDSEGVTVSLLIPDDARSGDYSLDIRIVSVNDAAVKDNATLGLKVKGEDSEGLLGMGSKDSLALIGIVVVFIILVFLTLIIVIARRKKAKRGTEEPKEELVVPDMEFEAAPAPTYQELYSNLPKVPDTPSYKRETPPYERERPSYERETSSYEGETSSYERERASYETAAEPSPFMVDGEDEFDAYAYDDPTDMGGGHWSEASDYGGESLVFESDDRWPSEEESGMPSWDDGDEDDFIEMPMRSGRSQEKKRRGKKKGANKKSQKKVEKDAEKFLGSIDGGNILDSLFDFDDGEVDADFEEVPSVEEKGVRAVEWD